MNSMEIAPEKSTKRDMGELFFHSSSGNSSILFTSVLSSEEAKLDHQYDRSTLNIKDTVFIKGHFYT